MIGAIIGDIVGSRFEFHPIKTKQFDLFQEGSERKTLANYINCSRFTDDTVMTLAVCKTLIDCKGNYIDLEAKLIQNMKQFGKSYPYVGYGCRFNKWLLSHDSKPYNSFGNGSAMRISSIPYFAKSLEDLKILSFQVSKVTHNHPEGIKGAEATAVAIWLAKNGATKYEIRKYIESNYYKLNFDYNELVKNYNFNETCQGSVPQSIFGFLISTSYEDTLRTVVSMGGDSDTMCAIAGAIAEAYYGDIPENIKQKAKLFLDDEMLSIINEFVKFKNLKENV